MDHDMGASMGACQMSMLWNWSTVDACFMASSWHVTSGGTMAATCIGVVLLVVLVEFARRLAREYDEHLLRQFSRQASRSRAKLPASEDLPGEASKTSPVVLRALPLQQLTRAVLYALVVAGAYILMLIAMSFNGYVIICIFIGAGLGKFFCDWLVVKVDLREGGLGVDSRLKGDKEAGICCV